MLKLWKVNAKAGDATVKYPFAPFPTNKDMRGKPEHNAELCIACGACGVACPADAIRMDTDLAADTITWSIDYGRCIFCGRCEEACPMEAIKLTEEFELAVMSKDDLTSKSVYTLEHCSRCGKPFAPHKEIDYAKRLLQKAGGMEAVAGRPYRRYVPGVQARARRPARRLGRKDRQRARHGCQRDACVR